MRHRLDAILRYAGGGLALANIALGATLLLRGDPDQASDSARKTVPVLERLDARQTEEAVLPHAPVANVGVERCLVSPAFATLRDAMALAAQIEAGGGFAEVRAVPLEGRPDHVVYVRPAASRDAARRIRQELEGQSIRGQVVGEGVLVNAVTVGVFADVDDADALMARIAAFGYPVERRPLARDRTIYVVRSSVRIGQQREMAWTGMAWTPCDGSALDGLGKHPSR